MSGSINPLQPPPPPAPANAPVAAPIVPNPISQAVASRAMRGRTQEHVLRRRDAAGGEMDMLVKVMNEPNPNPKEVTDYIAKLLQKDHISAQEAGHVLASMPNDPAALRNWAHMMFSAVMHEGIHAEAAFPRELFPSSGQPPPQGAPPPGSPAPQTGGNGNV